MAAVTPTNAIKSRINALNPSTAIHFSIPTSNAAVTETPAETSHATRAARTRIVRQETTVTLAAHGFLKGRHTRAVAISGSRRMTITLILSPRLSLAPALPLSGLPTFPQLLCRYAFGQNGSAHP